MLATAALALVIFGLGSIPGLVFCSPLANAAGQVLSRCSSRNSVALTFDDGPYIYLRNITDTLNAAGAKGTFFFNGNNYNCIYDDDSVARIKYVLSHGHQVAQHTWSHPSLPTLNREQIDTQFSMINDALVRILGVKPAFMRPPYGDYNDVVLDVARDHGQAVILWDFDSGDSTGSTALTSDEMYDSLAKQHPPTILSLNHETLQTTAHTVLPHAIEALQDAGYKLVTVAECLGIPPYQSVVTPSAKNSEWTCGGDST